ncbi:MAG: glycosyltransferase family 39 protein, partial [Oligoflexia bacterium]|nr:glycosyltransferase family 39 protein [Oligoflexia bacterium]
MNYRGFKQSIVANYVFAIVIFIVSFIFLSKNIDKKMLWSDEAIAIAIINGVNINSVFKDIQTSNLGSSTKNLNTLLSEQANTNSLDVLLSVNIHPPIYFFLSSMGMRLFNLKNAPRLTSAIAISFLSVLVFFLFMHFTKNTFYSFFSGVLFSLSPFFYIYGQEARPTALAILFNALFMCAFFLFFKNQNSKKYKVLFSVSAILSLLTSFLSFFILLVQF